MSGKSAFGAGRRISGIVIGGLLLSGCVDGEFGLPFDMPTFGDPSSEPAAIVANAGVPFEERDIEAPEEFSLTAQGLWDGRPSLGGVWVAHADVDAPGRVLIRNTATGEQITGALFRRERETPGPSIQVSSDAAEAIGLVAGNPQTLEVVALRRETVAAPVAPDPAFEAAETVAASAPPAVTAVPLATAGAVSAVAPDVPTPSLPEPEPAPAPVADILPEPVAPADPLGPLDASTVPLTAEDQPDPLIGAAAAIDAAEANSFLAASSSLGAQQPFVLAGVYSAASNAENAANQIETNRLPARVVQGEAQGSTIWRVLVGPASSPEAQTAILADVQQMGFTDAYFVAE